MIRRLNLGTSRPSLDGEDVMTVDVTVRVESTDPVRGFGLSSMLARTPWLTLTDADRCDVLVLLGDTLDEAMLEVMRGAHRAGGGEISCIVIADEITEQQVSAAARLGLIGLLHRSTADARQVRDLIEVSRSVRPVLPGSVVSTLVSRFREDQGARVLSAQEAAVLSLFADGLTVADVGRELGLRPGRISTIERQVVGRLKLRNRAHAVAYAVRMADC